MEVLEKMTAVFLALSVLFSNSLSSVAAAFQFKAVYCTISNNCDCDFHPDLQGLEWELYRNVYGQHLAQEAVSERLAEFINDASPEKPLVLSFHGSSGTGKTMVSWLLGRYLYGSAMTIPHVHRFIPTLHFPYPHRVPQYKKELKAWVEGNLTACARSVFVFDEMDKMPPGLIDVLVPFLGSSHVVYQTNYRKAIYVFISTAGEEQINRLALEARRAGRDREEIRLEELEDAIAQAVFNNSCNGLYHSEIIQEKLVDCFVPFLPLTRRHVERCVRRELCLRGQCHRRDIIEAITGAMTFSPERERLFSHSGCKTVPAKVNYYL
ncbi:torsin-2A-like isoform X2 [Acipenser ruthenus]|uniref:torsin-2A-like isoform X2 n=1 Tax=Acipenser ruthenus TaxID=7906 RepID=UPI00145B9B0A|nr:torsin-2A-like isoform X2 [Acipenser ruthenus]